MSNNPLSYLVVDVDDNFHITYTGQDLGLAMQRATNGLHVYIPVWHGHNEGYGLEPGDLEEVCHHHNDLVGQAARLQEAFILLRAQHGSLNDKQGLHSDDRAVNNFAQAMKLKLEKSRSKGRHGWDDPKVCSVELLCDLLLGHLGKGNAGNFEDVANFCMMLHQRGADPEVLAKAFNYLKENAVGRAFPTLSNELAKAKARVAELEWEDPKMTVFLRGGREMKVPYDLELMAFEFEGTCIQNPFVSECSRFPASPTYYGFEVYDTGGGCQAYKRDMPNGNYLLLTTEDGLLPDEESDVDGAIMGLYTPDGEQIAQINVADIPMEG